MTSPFVLQRLVPVQGSDLVAELDVGLLSIRERRELPPQILFLRRRVVRRVLLHALWVCDTRSAEQRFEVGEETEHQGGLVGMELGASPLSAKRHVYIWRPESHGCWLRGCRRGARASGRWR